MDFKLDTSTIAIMLTTIIVLSLIKWFCWMEKFPKSHENPKSDKVIVRVWTSKGNIRYPGSNFGHVSLELQMNGEPGSLKDFSYISLCPGEKLDNTNNVKLYNILSKHPPKYMDNYKDDLKDEKRVPELTFQFHTLDAIAMQNQFKKHLSEKTTCWTLCKNIAIGEAKNTKTEFIINIVSHVISKLLMLLPNTFAFVNCNDFGKETPEAVRQDNEPYLVNCVSLVKEILVAGSLSKLVTKRDKIKSSLYSSKMSSKYISKLFAEDNPSVRLTSLVYVIEHGMSFLCLSPDVFGDLLMYAKENEIKLLTHSLNEARDFTEVVVLDDGTEKIFKTSEWLPNPNLYKRNFFTHLFSTAALFSLAFAMYTFCLAL